mgnify:CR=1 FL=1
MKITCTTNNQGVLLKLSGRFDTAATTQAKTDIAQHLQRVGNVVSLICDCSELEYISSSGLRIMLSLAKQYQFFKITELSPEVYQVFEMTGFTKIMKVEKALRKMSVDGCDIIGRGGVGVVYRIDDDTIIKVFREGTSLDEVQTEIRMAKEAFVLGMPTAISFDVVKVGQQYGLVYELLKAETLSSCVSRNPQLIDEFAKKYAQLFRQLHEIEVDPDGQIPNALDLIDKSIVGIGKYFTEDEQQMMRTIIAAIPKGNRLLHCDLQTKNAMVQGEELLLIDMGEVGYGHPIIDLGNSYSAMMSLIGDYKQIIGMDEQLAQQMWMSMIHYYFEGETEDFIQHRIKQIDVVARVRNFTWLSLSDSFPQEVINTCRQEFIHRITDNKGYILDVCKTLDDWTL